jgi:hypothetical protein
MITSYEVGAVFKIINQASPALVKILQQVRELSAAIDKAKESLATIGKMPGVGVAIGETGDLAKAWGDVAKNAGAARLAIGNAAAAARRSLPAAAAAATGGVGGGGAGRHRPRWLGAGAGVPGHHFRTPGMATAAALGWGIDQAVKTEDYTWQLEDISGLPHDDITHAKFRKMLQDFQVRRGRGIDEASKAALSAIRLMQGVPGGGIDTLPEFLDAADTEARRKHTGLEEAMEANISLAHQFKSYTPEKIKGLMAMFAGLSTADPRTLSAMTRAGGNSNVVGNRRRTGEYFVSRNGLGSRRHQFDEKRHMDQGGRAEVNAWHLANEQDGFQETRSGVEKI